MQLAPNAPPGVYTVLITTVSNAGNASTSYSLYLAKTGTALHYVTVAVHDIFGIPVTGASVTLDLAGRIASTQTSANGTVMFSQMPSSPFNATISFWGASSVLSGNSAGNPEIDVTVVMSYPVALSAGLLILVPVIIILLLRIRRSSSTIKLVKAA
jgi:hypothetical protein